jgi:hypothetical protein
MRGGETLQYVSSPSRYLSLLFHAFFCSGIFEFQPFLSPFSLEERGALASQVQFLFRERHLLRIPKESIHK